MRHLKFLLAILLFFGWQHLSAQSDSSAAVQHWWVRGYVKNLQTWAFTADKNSLYTGGFFHQRLQIRWMPSAKWTVEGALRTRLFYGEWVRLQPGWADQLDADNGLADLSFVPIDRPALLGTVAVDRLYGQFQQGKWQVRLGRQRVNWGMALTWNPNDWFNAYNFLDFDYEERPGSDALRVQYQISDFRQLELAVRPAQDSGQWVAALRLGGHSGTYDWQLLGGVFQNKAAAGIGWAGDLGRLGFKGEISAFQPLGKEAGPTVLSATAGLDALVGGKYLLGGGLLINTNGLGNSAGLAQLSSTTLSADNLMPGKISLLVSASGSFTPLLNGALAVIYSPNGQLLVVVPSLTWSVTDNWSLDLTGQCFWLEEPPGHFYNGANGVYLRTRWSF